MDKKYRQQQSSSAWTAMVGASVLPFYFHSGVEEANLEANRLIAPHF